MFSRTQETLGGPGDKKLEPEEWRKRIELMFKMMDATHKEDYPAKIDRVAYNFGRGDIVLIAVEIAEALNAAQQNPSRETWLRLKKVLLENPPPGSPTK